MEINNVRPVLDSFVPFVFLLNETFDAFVRNWLVGFRFNKQYSSFYANVIFIWHIPTTDHYLSLLVFF